MPYLLPQAETITADDVDLIRRPVVPLYGLRFTGYLAISNPGPWHFTLTSDEGSLLALDGVEILSMDHIQPATAVSATVKCSAGLISQRLDYYERGGEQLLRLE